MKIVYKELATVESNLHKAYYQVEDFDLNEWNNAFESAREEDESISDSMSWEYDSENKIVIVTIRADKHSATIMANIVMFSCLASPSEDFDVFKSDDNYIIFSFSSHLSPSYFHYIFGQLDNIEMRFFEEKIHSRGQELFLEFWMRLVKRIGLEQYLGHLSIRIDSNTLEKGKEILETGSVSAFAEWLYPFLENLGKLPDYTDINYGFIAFPLFDSFYQGLDVADDFIYEQFARCVKSHEKEYNRWRKSERLQRSKYRTYSIAEYMLVEKISLEGLFSIYDSLTVDFFDYLFRTMNSDQSVMQLNQDIVDKINKFPNPRLAEIANERYKEYRKWSRDCLDFEFKSVHPQVDSSRANDNPVLKEVEFLANNSAKRLPEGYLLKKWPLEGEQDESCLKLNNKIPKSSRKFCILINAMAKLGYVEDTKENLERMAIALSGFGGPMTEGQVKLLKKNKKGVTSKAIWFLMSKIVEGSKSEGKRQTGEKYGSKYDKAKELFYFEDPKEQENFMTKSRNPDRAEDDIKCLVNCLYKL